MGHVHVISTWVMYTQSYIRTWLILVLVWMLSVKASCQNLCPFRSCRVINWYLYLAPTLVKFLSATLDDIRIHLPFIILNGPKSSKQTFASAANKILQYAKRIMWAQKYWVSLLIYAANGLPRFKIYKDITIQLPTRFMAYCGPLSNMYITQ